MPRLTVIYTRISADRDGHALGVDRQRRGCETLCLERGWGVDVVYVDNNRSAYSSKVRPEYRRLLAAVESGTVGRIVAWHPDRLHRSPSELEEFITLVELHKVKVDTVQAGQWDLSTASGRMIARQLGSVARYESEHRSERVRLKLAENATNGTPHGRRAFGWDRERAPDRTIVETINAAEAGLIKTGARAIISGSSLASVARTWQASGVRPPGASAKRQTGTWHKASVRAVLLRPRNAGHRQHHGELIGTGTWEPILTQGEFDQLVSVLKDPTRRTSTGTAAKHLLSGIARCGICGQVVHAARNRQTEAYRCKGRGCVARNRNDSDAYVTEVVLCYLEGQDVAKLLAATGQAAELQALRDTVEQLRARLDLAADDYADGKIDSRQLARISARLRPQIQTAESRASERTSDAAVTAIVSGGEIRAAWAAAPLTTRRAVVASLMRISILRARQGARVFDPKTVQIDWLAT